MLLGFHRCKKNVAFHRNTSSSSSTTNSTFSPSTSTMNITGSTSGSGSSQSGKQNSKLNNRLNRIQFHKRNSSSTASIYHQTSLSSTTIVISTHKDSKIINSCVYDKNKSISYNPSPNSAFVLLQQQPTTSNIRFVPQKKLYYFNF
jgi:hypothetical protein